MNQNYTLKFGRTWRDLHGTDCQFEKPNPDKYVGWAFALGLAFFLGLLAGAA